MTTRTRTEPRRSAGSTDWFFAAALAVLSIGIPLAIAHHHGALGSPRSDDWSYLRTLFTWHEHGDWDFNNWVSMTLVGQILLTAPVVALFGESITAVRVLVAGLGFVGLLACVDLGRTLGVRREHAWFVAAVVAAGPLWAPLAASYMTDVPAFGLQLLALAVAARALARPAVSLPLLAVATAIGFVAITIRQYAAVSVIAFLLVAAWQLARAGDRRGVRTVGILAAAVAAASALLLAWWNTVPRSKSLAPQMPTASSIEVAIANGAGFLRLAGLLLVPLLLLARPRALVRRAWRSDRELTVFVLAGAVLWLAVSYAAKSRRPFVGNYVDRRGVLGDDIIILGTRPEILPPVLFDVLVVLGSVGALLLVAALVPWLAQARESLRARSLPSFDPVVATVTLSVIGFALAHGLAMATRLPVFDRYALAVLPLVGLLVLRRPPDPSAGAGTAGAPSERRVVPTGAMIGVVGLGLLGLAFAAESASYDGTRWKVATLAVDAGWHPTEIDGGYEWVGWHRGDGPLTADTVAERQKLRAAYYQGLCVTVGIDLPRLPDDTIAWRWSDAPTRERVRVVAVPNDRPCRVSTER